MGTDRGAARTHIYDRFAESGGDVEYVNIEQNMYDRKRVAEQRRQLGDLRNAMLGDGSGPNADGQVQSALRIPKETSGEMLLPLDDMTRHTKALLHKVQLNKLGSLGNYAYGCIKHGR